ncbi:CidA/LrgA family protein [Primorskyibacter sp. 2E233]|uniref:CidA/LrgA family protein n=1 Tax=Primorskyibacter sp. 2E233 TaxID=3413431 RepID=UPI003BF31AD6
MIRVLCVLLLFQLGGETISRALGLSVPGPVLGLAGLFVTLLMLPRLAHYMRETVTGLLSHLSLLFVPAGVGVVAHLDTFGRDGPGLILALVGSTILAILVGVGAFLLVVRLTGGSNV